MNKKLVIGVVIIAIIIIGGLVYFANPSNSGLFALSKTNEIVIGSIQPLTGNGASFGQNVKAAMLIAEEEINSNGGINGKNLRIIFEDGQCNAQAATTSIKKLIEVDGVTTIIGGTCSSETLAIAPIAEKAKVLVISNGASIPSLSDAGEYIFRDYPSDNTQGRIAAEYSYNILNARKAAILYWQSDWPMEIKKVFKNSFENLGGKVLLEESFTTGSMDMKTQLIKINESDADVIYFLGMTPESIIGLKQAEEIGLKQKIIGGDPWDNKEFWESIKDLSEGKIFVSSKPTQNTDFVSKMEKANAQNIPSTAQAYDAVKIISNALSKCNTNTECQKDFLYNMPPYQGVSGVIEFDSKGDLKHPNFSVKIVKNGIMEEVADVS
jgi:branched-chain amino acid transport system substrate-binding protein